MAALNFPSSPSVNDTYSANGKTWRWNGTSWVTVASGGVGYTGSAGTGTTGYTTNIGNNSNTSFTVTHALNTTNVNVNIRDNSTGYMVYPDIKYVASNAILIEFATTPTTDQYKVGVIGYE